MTKTTVDNLEVAKFAQHAAWWWDKTGPLKTLHAINPVRLEFIQKQTPLAQLRVLDVGCGGGILSEAMAQSGAHVTGLDVEPDSVSAAKSHALLNALNIEYVLMPIESFKADAFDVVTCMEMLEHVKDPSMVIEHCARLLKPGGTLFLSTINRTLKAYASVVIAAEYLLNLLPRQTHDYDKFIKPSELARMCRMYDLEVIDMAGIAYHPFEQSASLNQSLSANYLLVCRK